ncbi:hypothetical protein VNO77_02914 [Canavalia gladiata]|uniref:Uncharacterized protein n=1 Tax=Canavalia gladiata TaxID=3824 RepID=A0AAN9MUH5_CANGL
MKKGRPRLNLRRSVELAGCGGGRFAPREGYCCHRRQRMTEPRGKGARQGNGGRSRDQALQTQASALDQRHRRRVHHLGTMAPPRFKVQIRPLNLATKESRFCGAMHNDTSADVIPSRGASFRYQPPRREIRRSVGNHGGRISAGARRGAREDQLGKNPYLKFP